MSIFSEENTAFTLSFLEKRLLWEESCLQSLTSQTLVTWVLRKLQWEKVEPPAVV